MSELPLVGVTMGDPAGIGPEVVIKACLSPDVAAVLAAGGGGPRRSTSVARSFTARCRPERPPPRWLAPLAKEALV